LETDGDLDILLIARKEITGADFWELKGTLESSLRSILTG